MAWHAKETLRGFYDQPADTAATYLSDLAENLRDTGMPRELQQLGRTLRTWRSEICAFFGWQDHGNPVRAPRN